MKKFTFSLEPVLDHRERIEDEKQQVLALRQRELQQAQDELARLHDEFKHHATSLREDHRKFGGEELRRHYAHLEYLDRCITMAHAVVAQRRQAVERARQEVVTASKDRKIMEKLKDKRLEQHRAAEAYVEQRELDDANARRESYRDRYSPTA